MPFKGDRSLLPMASSGLHKQASATVGTAMPGTAKRSNIQLYQFRWIMMDIWWIYDGYMMDIWWIYDGYMMDIWWIYDGYMMDIWWIYDGYMMDIAWHRVARSNCDQFAASLRFSGKTAILALVSCSNHQQPTFGRLKSAESFAWDPTPALSDAMLSGPRTHPDIAPARGTIRDQVLYHAKGSKGLQLENLETEVGEPWRPANE